MSDGKEQMKILKEIIVEDFEAIEADRRSGGSVLFEVSSIEGVEIPEGITVIVNFDDGKKIGWSGPENQTLLSARVDTRFKGNLNVFIMRKKKVLKRVHVTFTEDKYRKRWNTYSLREILECV